jgi:hypothetical protein
MYRSLLAGWAVLVLTGSASAGAADYFTETSKDFGTTPRGPVLTHYFYLKNTTNKVVTMTAPRVSCGCVTATILKGQLQPGETTAVVAYLDTKKVPVINSQRVITVYVPFVTPVAEEVQLKVSATARDDLVMSPDTLAFGTLRKGAGGKVTTKVTFFSDPKWVVNEPTSSGLYVKAAVKEVKRGAGEVAYEVTAELDPACPTGNWTADIWVKTSTPGMEKLRIPVTVNVINTIAVNPEAVSFGDVKVGQPAEQKVILQASAKFKILEVKGADDGEVKVKDTNPDAGPVHVLLVTFTPKKAGEHKKSIEIVTDSTEQPKVIVPFTAKAK